jgi:hypothetical protein
MEGVDKDMYINIMSMGRGRGEKNAGMHDG